MNWTSLVLATLAGAMAGVLARVFAGDPKENQGAFAGTFVVALLALMAVSRTYVQPWFDLRTAEAALLEIPAYQAIKKYDPKAYAGLMDDVRQSLKSGSSRQEIFGIFRNRLTTIVQTRLPTASDEAVVTYMSATMAELDELYQRGGDLCHRFMFPQPGDAIDGSKYFSKQAQDADLAALARVIETSARDPQVVPRESDVMPRLQPIFTQLANEYGRDIALLQNPGAPSVDRRKICTMTASLYGKILGLPPDEGGKILRYLVSQT